MQTKSRRLELSDTFSGFMRELGLNPNTGRGKRGDAKRLRNQMERLFGAEISFRSLRADKEGREGKAWLDMKVAPKGEMWWDPKSPEQLGMWGSWVELSEDFFKAITSAPIPLDLRVLRSLKHSPLALDLYVWATHKVDYVLRKGKPQFISWHGLMAQFGSDYSNLNDFRTKAIARLKVIQDVYPDLKLADATGGLTILPASKTAVPTKSTAF